ncbi:MAG TPA: hypothetical protein VFJ43_13405 [Bacteroidia bacterium]|nr:hypothetical protein [Bacteroidia bacterium]
MGFERTGHHANDIHRQHDDWDEVHHQLLAIRKKSLEASNPNDVDEKEADEVARKVVDGESAEIHGTGGTINRKGESIDIIQRQHIGSGGVRNNGGTNYRFDTYQITGEDLNDADIKNRLDGLGESGLINYFSKNNDPDIMHYVMDLLMKNYPDLPTIAQLVYNQLNEAIPNSQIVFVNLQKLNKDQTRIDEFKLLYQKEFFVSLENHLRSKLKSNELGLSLDLINVKDDLVKTNFINLVLPATDDDYKAIAARLNVALLKKDMEKEEIYSELIPLNRDKIILDKLRDIYTLIYGQKLDDDIKNKMMANDAVYAFYLLNALPAMESHTDEAAMNTTGDTISGSVVGGKIDVHTNAKYTKADLAKTVRPTGFIMNYEGGLAKDTHWLQFIWREIVYYTKDIDDKEVENKRNDPIQTSGGHYDFTDNPKTPSYNVDSPQVETPFYEGAFADNRTSESTTIFDFPSSMRDYIDNCFTNKGATRVVSRAHFNTFLIRDFSTVFQVSQTIEWSFNALGDPEKMTYHDVSTQNVTSLPVDMKKRLDSQYKSKFSYIQ